MRRGSILLNGITPYVSPMRSSRHPRAKLLNGDGPPLATSASAPGRVTDHTCSDSRPSPPRFLAEVSRPSAWAAPEKTASKRPVRSSVSTSSSPSEAARRRRPLPVAPPRPCAAPSRRGWPRAGCESEAASPEISLRGAGLSQATTLTEAPAKPGLPQKCEPLKAAVCRAACLPTSRMRGCDL